MFGRLLLIAPPGVLYRVTVRYGVIAPQRLFAPHGLLHLKRAMAYCNTGLGGGRSFFSSESCFFVFLICFFGLPHCPLAQ